MEMPARGILAEKPGPRGSSPIERPSPSARLSPRPRRFVQASALSASPLLRLERFRAAHKARLTLPPPPLRSSETSTSGPSQAHRKRLALAHVVAHEHGGRVTNTQ